MRAIDVHIHVPGPPGGGASERGEAMARYFGRDAQPRTVEHLYELYKGLDIFGVIFGNNDWTASVVQKYPDQFIGFAMVDPKDGQKAVDEGTRAVQERGVGGLAGRPAGRRF